MRAEAEHQFREATQERSKLEEKLTQVERNAEAMLKQREQSHKEQLEAEHEQKVHDGLEYAIVGFKDHLPLVCVMCFTGASVC